MLAVRNYCYVVVCSALTGEERGGGIPFAAVIVSLLLLQYFDTVS